MSGHKGANKHTPNFNTMNVMFINIFGFRVFRWKPPSREKKIAGYASENYMLVNSVTYVGISGHGGKIKHSSESIHYGY